MLPQHQDFVCCFQIQVNLRPLNTYASKMNLEIVCRIWLFSFYNNWYYGIMNKFGKNFFSFYSLISFLMPLISCLGYSLVYGEVLWFKIVLSFPSPWDATELNIGMVFWTFATDPKSSCSCSISFWWWWWRSEAFSGINNWRKYFIQRHGIIPEGRITIKNYKCICHFFHCLNFRYHSYIWFLFWWSGGCIFQKYRRIIFNQEHNEFDRRFHCCLLPELYYISNNI